jgi:hypothetical protein
MPPVYSKQGFERREILNMTAWEKESGLVHEATNYNPGNEIQCTDAPAPKLDPKIVHDITTDVAKAFASGPFTGGDNLL